MHHLPIYMRICSDCCIFLIPTVALCLYILHWRCCSILYSRVTGVNNQGYWVLKCFPTKAQFINCLTISLKLDRIVRHLLDFGIERFKLLGHYVCFNRFRLVGKKSKIPRLSHFDRLGSTGKCWIYFGFSIWFRNLCVCQSFFF